MPDQYPKRRLSSSLLMRHGSYRWPTLGGESMNGGEWRIDRLQSTSAAFSTWQLDVPLQSNFIPPENSREPRTKNGVKFPRGTMPHCGWITSTGAVQRGDKRCAGAITGPSPPRGALAQRSFDDLNPACRFQQAMFIPFSICRPSGLNEGIADWLILINPLLSRLCASDPFRERYLFTLNQIPAI